jgi:DNA-binding CsgD family transcriptional regulator
VAGAARHSFVGRSDELRVLRDRLVAARHGQPHIVVVEGEPGIGKTALIRELAVRSADVTTVWASGDETESALEFGLINQLTTALPNTSAPTARTDAFAVGASLLIGVGELEKRGPVLVVIDDVHWIDVPSSRSLLFFLRRLRSDPLLVVLASRPRSLGRLGPSWERLLADPRLVRRIELSGLTTAEVRELAASSGWPIPARGAQRLQEHTAGNPLHVSALLSQLPATALDDDAAPLPAPHSYSATVLTRMVRLGKRAQGLIAAAAVFGQRCPLRDAVALAGVTDSNTAADEVVASGLAELVVRNGTQELVFCHPLNRASIYDDLSPAHRRRLHLAAAALLQPPASFRHRIAAGGCDEQLCLELLAAARQEQAAGALQPAAEYLLGAARVTTDSARSNDLLYEAVELLLLAGDVYRATAQQAAIESRPDSPYRRYTLAILASSTGDLEHSAADLRAVLESISPATDGALAGRCAAVLAYISGVLGDQDAAIGWAGMVRHAAGVPGAADAIAHQALAWGYAKSGRIDESLALLVACSASHDRPAPHENELLALRGAVRNWAGDVTGSIEDLHTVLRWIKQGYPLTDVVYAYASIAEAEFRAGDWTVAATHIELALSLAEDLDHGWYLSYARCVAAYLYAARGDRRFAVTNAAAAAQASALGPSTEAPAFAALARAHSAWAVEDWPMVLAALRPFEQGGFDVAAEHPNLALWRYRMAEAYLYQGRSDEVRRLLDDSPGPPLGGTSASDRARLEALLYQRAGQVAVAEACYGSAEAALDGSPPGLADGLLALQHGQFLAEQKRREQAVARLVRSRQIFATLGAAAFAVRAEQALAACGMTGLDGDLQSPRLDALTEREQVVARMVASGMTNREVATDLYLSVKAIEYHLGNIFDKLDIRSRRELRGLVGNVGLPAAAS